MESQSVLNIISLAPVYQILASFFIAFIVIEYAKSYTSIISKHIFDIEGIHDRYHNEVMIDKKVVQDCLSGEKWSKGQDLLYKQKFLGEIDKHLSELSTANILVQNKRQKQNEFESFRYISIYMFAYCMICLYAGGFFQVLNKMREPNFLFYYQLVSAFIVSLYYIFGSNKKCFNPKTRAINIVVVIVNIFLTLSTSLLGAWFKPLLNIEDSLYASVAEFTSAFLPSLVFIIGIIIVYFKSRNIKKFIETKYKPLQEEHDRLIEKFKNIEIRENVNKEVESIEMEGSPQG